VLLIIQHVCWWIGTRGRRATPTNAEVCCLNLRSQIGTSSWGGMRYAPMAFSEQGIAMLSSILNSERAIIVNIHIIRVFTRLREMMITHKDLLLKLEQLERKVTRQDEDIKLIFDHLKELLTPPTEPHRKIGFKF
jgi:hypothetical protein